MNKNSIFSTSLIALILSVAASVSLLPAVAHADGDWDYVNPTADDWSTFNYSTPADDWSSYNYSSPADDWSSYNYNYSVDDWSTFDYGYEDDYYDYSFYDEYYYEDYSDYGYDYYSYDYYDYDYDNTCYSCGCNGGCHNPEPEPVCALSIEDSTIEEGESTEIHWTSENALSATLTSFGSVPTGGNRTISPNSDQTYTLMVFGFSGEKKTCSAHVNVEEEEEDDLSCELDVSDSSVDEGDEVTLEWEIDGDADFASINQGIGRVDEDGGEEEVEVDEDTTFRLTVRNDDDEDTCSVTVRVDEENDFSSIDFEGDPVNNPPVVYLSQLPYTGIEDITPSMWGFIVTLFGLVAMGGYFFFVKRHQTA